MGDEDWKIQTDVYDVNNQYSESTTEPREDLLDFKRGHHADAPLQRDGHCDPA